MRGPVAALLVCAALLAGCGGGSSDPDRERLDSADRALAQRPADRRAMDRVIRVAYEGAGKRQDTGSGRYTADARPYLDRAAAVWPRYVAVTRERPAIPIASIMVQVLGNGLARPDGAAVAARYVAEANPNATSYLQLLAWTARAGDRRGARIASQKALELADPSERDSVRSRVRALLPQAG
jgi:hypothetical protein